MRIWHQSLIPLLCRQHLLAVWRESLGAYKIITEDKKGYRNHPAVKEFENAPLSLHFRLFRIREEILNRGYNPKEMPPVYYIQIPEQPPIPWQTLDQQIEILKAKGCDCNV